MRRLILAAMAVFGLGPASFGLPSVHAATVDTFNFSISGWAFAATITGPFGPEIAPGAPLANSDFGDTVLTGSFTGTVEPSGFIELRDLTAFSDSFFYFEPDASFLDLTTLTFFSYDTKGGASSLDIAGESPLAIVATNCVGAAVPLDGNCNQIFENSYEPGIDGVVFNNHGVLFAVTTAQPVITLVSSVTTTPEPSTWAMMLLGFGGLGFMGYRASARRRAALPA